MCDERRLSSNIQYLEDMMLRSKDMNEVARLRADLQELRKKQQQLKWKTIERERAY